MWYVQKPPGYKFYGRTVLHVLHCLSFFPGWQLAFLIFPPPPQIHFVLPTKNGSLSVALPLCRSFCRWASLALCRLFSLFLCLSLSLYSAFVDMTINLRLILLTTRIQKQFPLSVFFFIDSLGVSVSQDTGDYAISHQNNFVLHLGYHTCWLSCFILVCLWRGRTGGRSRDYQNFSDHIFGGMGLRSRAWSSSKNTIIGVLEIYLLKKIRNELYHRSLTSLRKMDIGRIERYPA